MPAPAPHTRWTTGREYMHVCVHDETACLLASSVQRSAFVLYDDAGAPVQDPASDPMPAYTERGALELFSRVGEEPVDG